MREDTKGQIDRLLLAVGHTNFVVRQKAVDELWSIAAFKPKWRKLCLAGIRAAVSDSNNLVRNVAVEALSEVGNRADFFRLSDRLSDSDWMVRASAASALSQCCGKRALKILMTVVREDVDEVVRAYAAVGIGDLGDSTVLAELEQLLAHDPSGRARVGLVLAIATLGGQGYEEEVATLLKSDSHLVKGPMLDTIEELIPYKRSDVARARLVSGLEELIATEPIEWLVLKAKDQLTALLLSAPDMGDKAEIGGLEGRSADSVA
jgi:HEAT repeat protein